MWFGKESAKEEADTNAYKIFELDDFFNGGVEARENTFIFILDTGAGLYAWRMGKSKPLIKFNTCIICQKIKDERKADPNIFFYDEGKKQKQIGNNLTTKTNNENEYDCGLYWGYKKYPD